LAISGYFLPKESASFLVLSCIGKPDLLCLIGGFSKGEFRSDVMRAGEDMSTSLAFRPFRIWIVSALAGHCRSKRYPREALSFDLGVKYVVSLGAPVGPQTVS
jgi:hypothetical protein